MLYFPVTVKLLRGQERYIRGRGWGKRHGYEVVETGRGEGGKGGPERKDSCLPESESQVNILAVLIKKFDI